MWLKINQHWNLIDLQYDDEEEEYGDEDDEDDMRIYSIFTICFLKGPLSEWSPSREKHPWC